MIARAVLLASLLCVSSMASAQSPSDVLKTGTVLTFERTSRVGQNLQPTDDRSTYTHKIDSVGDKIAVTEVGRSGKPRSLVAMRDIEFPLAVGKEWKHRLDVERVSAFGQPSTYRYDGKAVVAGEETLSVAGQTLKVYRIEVTGWVNRTGGSDAYSWQYARTDWYAPAMGYVVQSQYKEIDKGRAQLDLTFQLIKVEGP